MGKDPISCSSYRPLSLLNADVKVLAKAIASRLENVLPYIISEEQNGFIKGRRYVCICNYNKNENGIAAMWQEVCFLSQ